MCLNFLARAPGPITSIRGRYRANNKEQFQLPVHDSFRAIKTSGLVREISASIPFGIEVRS